MRRTCTRPPHACLFSAGGHASALGPSMRILIDLQGAQSNGSRRRGIGRYTWSLVQALARGRGDHEIIALINSAFADSADELRRDLSALLPADQLRFWTAPEAAGFASGADAFPRIAAESAREALIADIAPDFLLLTSLFEGYAEPVVTSVSRFAPCPTAVVLYDLIPYVFSGHYLANHSVREWYENKLNHLLRADLVLTISVATRNEAIRLLSLDPSTVVNISTAVDEDFFPHTGSQSEWSALRSRHRIGDKFILYTGGIDFRKNIDRLIAAFAEFSRRVQDGHQLVIVCSAEPAAIEHHLAEARRAGLDPGSVVFTGYVSHEELLIFYSRCALFVFPSFAEGFGLPVLEAMKCGAVVVGSRVSSVPEVIGLERALFDPFDVEDMHSKMVEAVRDEGFRADFLAHAGRQVGRFSWERTAAAAWTAMAERAASKSPARRPAWAKKSLAYVSPMPPSKSGIAQYSAELLPSFLELYEVTIISDGSGDRRWWAPLDIPVRSPSWLRANAARFDRVLYHFGNSEFHAHMFDLLEAVPGVVVLHDFFLTGILNHLDHQGREGMLASALHASHGYGPLALRSTAPWDVIERYPANYAVLTGALGTILHSMSAKDLGGVHYGQGVADSLHVVPLAQGRVQTPARDEARATLGLTLEDFLVCSFGMVHDRKHSEVLVRAWRQFVESLGNATKVRPRLVLVGSAQSEYERRLREIAGGDITVTGWASESDYSAYLAAADVAVQLRGENRGESSRSVLECMIAGLPTIVSSVGSFRELPDDTVVKVSREDEAGAVARAMSRLFVDPGFRRELSSAARDYVTSVHLPEKVATQYERCIEAAYAGRKGVMTEAWNAALDRCAPVGGPTLGRVADTLAPLYAGPGLRCRRFLLVAPDDADAVRVSKPLIMETGPTVTEPVRVDEAGRLRYARRLTCEALGIDAPQLRDELLDFRAGDVLIVCSGQALPETLHRDLRLAGVVVDGGGQRSSH